MSLKHITKLKNRNGEYLDFCIDGNKENPKRIFLYAHGFGNDLHDRGLADDIVKKAIDTDNESAFIRFSFSGYGNSEGIQKEKTLKEMSEDYADVYGLIKRNTDSKISAIGFSMGSHILANSNNLTLEKVIFISPSGINTAQGMKSYFGEKEGLLIDADGYWHIPRRSGTTTIVGEAFWEALEEGVLLKNMKKFTEKNSVYIILPKDDEVSTEDKEKTFSQFNGEIIRLPGTHDFLEEAREGLLKKISELIKK